jgi:hypothetical protein
MSSPLSVTATGTVYVATAVPIPSSRRILQRKDNEQARGEMWRLTSVTSDSAAHLLSFTIRWGSVPARVQIAFSRYVTPSRKTEEELILRV